jgi:hypothetical protein
MSEGSLGGWAEGILLIIGLIAIFGVVVTNMNGLYSVDNQIGMGTNTSASDFIEYGDNAKASIEGGEADFDSESGLTLKESWGITKNAFTIILSFITGGFIEDVFTYTNLGESGQTLALYLRIIWTLALIFAILYILFKVVT